MFGTLTSTQSESEPFISQVVRPPFESDRELKHLACLACRRKKLKCTGERKGCQRCLDRGLHCQYQEVDPHRGRRSRGISVNNSKNHTSEVERSADQPAAATAAATNRSDRSTPVRQPSEDAKANGGVHEGHEEDRQSKDRAGSLNGASLQATSDLIEEGMNPEITPSPHEPGSEFEVELQLSDILMASADDFPSPLFDTGHADVAGQGGNPDMLFLSQLAASAPPAEHPCFPVIPSLATPRCSPSTSRPGTAGMATGNSIPILAQLPMPMCACLRSALSLYESIRAVRWRAQCGVSTDLSRETAHLVLKACKLALDQCHRLAGCPACKREPLFVMLLCSVCDQCLTCFETFHNSHQKRLRSGEMGSSSTGSSLKASTEGRSEMDQLGEIVQLTNLPFGDLPVELDDEDVIIITRSLLTTRVASMVSLLRLLGLMVDDCTWRAHHDLFKELQHRCQCLAYSLQVKSKGW